MARISLDPPRTPTYRLVEWYSRRRFGKVAEPLMAVAHNPKVLRTDLRFEASLARWDRLDSKLKMLATLGAAAYLGCSFCVDIGSWAGQEEGLDPDKVRDIARWRDSTAYTDLERQALAYAEAMSGYPITVTDEMVAGLREHLDEAQLVELTMMVAVENLRSRGNIAMGMTSQGFSDHCAVPATAIAAASTLR